MGEFEKQRKSMPVPSGAIPYWRYYELDGCTYSIDKCRLRFPLRWGQLRLISGDELLLPTDQNMVKCVAALLQSIYGGVLTGAPRVLVVIFTGGALMVLLFLSINSGRLDLLRIIILLFSSLTLISILVIRLLLI